MSVYTPVTAEDLDAWLTRYAVGGLEELQPIASGIENTNYFVRAPRNCFVLTLYERLPAAELPFYLNLMAHLARSGCEVPAPEPDRTGALRQAARAVKPFIDADQAALLDAELKFQTGFGRGKLPKGAIHGDLFCDNVLFADDRVAGIIDFGFAATDFFAYDLAITVNDWCVTGGNDPAVDADCAAALIGAYDARRPMTPDECTAWPALLRAAALRFWLSRLYDMHLPRSGELTHAHDPAHFERILRERIARPARIH